MSATLRSRSMSTRALDHLTGDCIASRFTLGPQLGAGGSAVVFRGSDRSSNLSVAIKIAHQDPGSAARLAHECEVLRRFDTPHIPHVRGFGYLESGAAYLVLDAIEGATLKEVIVANRISLTHALDTIEAILRALVAVHRAGIIHRDVKPGNIMVPVHDGSYDYKNASLIDFGVAADCRAGSSCIGMVNGTVVYMAPEQLAGRAQTTQTDLFALGCVMYELLFGAPPDSELPAERASLAAVGAVRVFGGAMVLQRLTSDIAIPQSPAQPLGVVRCLQRLLQRDPTRRMPSATEALDEIGAARAKTSRPVVSP